MSDLATDVSTLPANTAALAAAASTYLSDPSNGDNRDALINALAADATNVAAVGSDISEIIQENPEAAAVAKAAGITGFIASSVALVTDTLALVDQLKKGETDPATVLAVVGDLASTSASGARVAVEIGLLPEEAAIGAAAVGLYGAATVFAGAGVSAVGALMSYEEGQTGGDEVLVVGNSVTYANGLKGAWSDAGDDGNGNPTQSTYQTWNPSTGQVVGSLTVPIADKEALSSNGMTISVGGQQEAVGSDGSLTHIENGSASQEANGMQRVLEDDGSSYVQTARDGEVDIGNGPVGNQQVNFDGSTPLPYQAAVSADTSSTDSGSSATINLNGALSSVTSQTQSSSGLFGQTTTTMDANGNLVETYASIDGFGVSQSNGSLSLDQDGQGGLSIESSNSYSGSYDTIASGYQSGGGAQIVASYIQASLDSSSAVLLDGDGNTVHVSPYNEITLETDGAGYNGSYNDNVYGDDITVNMGSSNTYSTVWGSGITVQDAAGVTGGVAGFEGNGDVSTIIDGQVNAGTSNQSITIDGSNDSIYGGPWSGDQFTLGANQTDYVYGSNETIYGNGDDIVDYGNGNTIYADGSTVTDEGSDDMTYGDDDTVYGYGSGDGVNGTGDTGGTWYTGGSGGSGGTYWGSWGFDDASRQNRTNTVSSFDQSQGNAKAATAASLAWSKASQAIAAATTPGAAAPSALNTARWGKTNITWSFADGATSGADAISGAVQSQYQMAVEQAFQTWAAASGVTFREVASGAKSDITVGWGDLDPADSGALGYTNTTTRGGLIQGATIRLEDPSEDALVADASGAYTYSGSTTTLEQLVLHEIGHTLGMAESSNINSIMFPELSASNTALSASDLQAVAILYPQTSPAAGTDTTAMAQAMASFSAQAPTGTAGAMNAGMVPHMLQPAIAIPAY